MLRKSMKFDDKMRYLLYCIFGIQFLISSCTAPMNLLVNNTAVATPTFGAAITKVSTVSPSCKSNMIDLNELIDGKSINNYLWSENGQYIYIQSGDDWWKYSVKDQELKSLSNFDGVPIRTPYPIEQAISLHLVQQNS